MPLFIFAFFLAGLLGVGQLGASRHPSITYFVRLGWLLFAVVVLPFLVMIILIS